MSSEAPERVATRLLSILTWSWIEVESVVPEALSAARAFASAGGEHVSTKH